MRQRPLKSNFCRTAWVGNHQIIFIINMFGTHTRRYELVMGLILPGERLYSVTLLEDSKLKRVLWELDKLTLSNMEKLWAFAVHDTYCVPEEKREGIIT